MSEQTPMSPNSILATKPPVSYGTGRALLVLALPLLSGVPYILLFIFLPIHERVMPYAAAGIILAAAAMIISKKPMAALGHGERVNGAALLQIDRFF